MTKEYEFIFNTMAQCTYSESTFNDVYSHLDKSRVNEILAEETGYKNTLYFCSEDDSLLTLSDLFHDFMLYEKDYLGDDSFSYWLDCATDMGGSLREIMSIRHYLYMINFYVESAEKDYFVPYQESVIYHQI